MIHYIYQIINMVNNKNYVGYTSRNSPNVRWKQHIKNSSNPQINHRPLYRALNKYGIEAFKFELIYCSKDQRHTLSVMENYFIKQCKSYIAETGYNLTMGGESNFGWIPSDETRELWSSQRKGRKFTEEQRQECSRVANRRYKDNPELREHLRQIALKSGCRPPPPTLETRAKSARTRTGMKIHSEKRKQQLRWMAQNGELKLNSNEAKERKKQTWKQIGRGTGAKNGMAVFCKIFDPSGELVGNGFLRDECERINAPFNKFLAASRHENALQRGEWKGWKIVRIPKK